MSSTSRPTTRSRAAFRALRSLAIPITFGGLPPLQTDQAQPRARSRTPGCSSTCRPFSSSSSPSGGRATTSPYSAFSIRSGGRSSGRATRTTTWCGSASGSWWRDRAPGCARPVEPEARSEDVLSGLAATRHDGDRPRHPAGHYPVLRGAAQRAVPGKAFP